MNRLPSVLAAVSAVTLAAPAPAAGPAPFFITSALNASGGGGIETTGTFVNVMPMLTPPTSTAIALDPDAAVATYFSAGGSGPATATMDAVTWDFVNTTSSTSSRLSFLASITPQSAGLVAMQSQPIVFNGQAREALFFGRVVTQIGEAVTANVLFAASESQVFNDATERGFFEAELDGSPITEWGINGLENFEPSPRTYFFVSETSIVNGLQVVDLYLHNPSPGSLALAIIAGVAAVRRRR
ncbi:MAG: hypothetical protein AAGI30_07585 [Planctomycetota bacterium]